MNEYWWCRAISTFVIGLTVSTGGRIETAVNSGDVL